jgi:hypothetical protein
MNHKRFLLLVFAAMMTLSCAGAGRSAGDVWPIWKPDKFIISTWGDFANGACAQALADAGFNTVMAYPSQLKMCAAHGLRAIVFTNSLAQVTQYKNDPGVWSWYVRDEPWNMQQYQEVAAKIVQIRAIDTTHPCYVNLGGAFTDHSGYMETVKPDFLSFDHYEWWWPSYQSETHFRRLEEYRAAAVQAGMPLLCWIESNADPKSEAGDGTEGYLPDNAVKLRHSVYTDLAYGTNGIQWFTVGMLYEGSTNTRVYSPVLSKSGQDVAVLNHEVQTLGSTLIKLDSVDVFHTAPVFTSCRSFPGGYWVTSSTPGMCFGIFRDANAGRYVMPVNRSITTSVDAVLKFDSTVKVVSRLDKTTGKWVKLNLLSDGTLRITLAPGDGQLLSTAASLDGSLILEDFSGDISKVSAIAKLRKSGSIMVSQSLSLGTNGEFTMTGLKPDTYELWIKASHWLAKLTAQVTVDGPTTIGPVSLVNGDCNGNNAVDLLDLALLKQNWGLSSPTNPTADLNGDGSVGLSDLLILKRNWAKSGSL